MNVYKPRYKIAFQSKNKIWPYKDSRLRRFFNIRGRKLVRRGLFKRYVVVLNNMKWTIARRYIRPYMRRRKAVRQRYKNRFYNKQKLRAFYGKIKEEKFRNFFKKHMHEGNKRNLSLFASLERRVDVFLFRLRLLPTIFACSQYILHYGVYINKGKINTPGALVRVGDMLSVPDEHWQIMYNYLKERIYYRLYGKVCMIKRKYKKLKKKTWWLFTKKSKRSLLFILKLKRRYLDLFILEKKKDLTAIFNNFIFLFKKLLLKKDLTNFLEIKDIFFNFYMLKHKIKTFILMEKMRRKLFYFQRVKYKLNIKKLKQQNKSTKKLNNPIFKFKLVKTKRSYLSNFQPDMKMAQNPSISNWKKLSAQLLDKKQNNQLNLHFVHLLKSISNTYYNWLSLLLQLKLNEINFYFWLLISIKGNHFEVNSELQQIIQAWKHFLFLQTAYLKKYITIYYQSFFRKFLRLETRKNNKKLKWIKIEKDNQPALVQKTVVTGNILTYFLYKRKLRMRRKKKVTRLKNIHWAIPNYIHFDLRTLRAIYLYSPMSHEIIYPFKCSLTQIVSFYKALAL